LGASILKELTIQEIVKSEEPGELRENLLLCTFLRH